MNSNKNKLNSEIIFIFKWYSNGGLIYFPNLSLKVKLLEHYHQLFYKKCHFDTPKSYFIILPYHFTIFHSSDILFFNSIH